VLRPRFDDIALIDFAFSLVSGERLESALPIAEQADYEYQSPRLLRALESGRAGDLGPTRQLDWRCDLFSLAAMLWRYLPELEDTTTGVWTRTRHAKARALVRRLIEAHDAELPDTRPHAELIALTAEPLAQPGCANRCSAAGRWRSTAASPPRVADTGDADRRADRAGGRVGRGGNARVGRDAGDCGVGDCGTRGPDADDRDAGRDAARPYRDAAHFAAADGERRVSGGARGRTARRRRRPPRRPWPSTRAMSRCECCRAGASASSACAASRGPPASPASP
jgi:hypothetical protein